MNEITSLRTEFIKIKSLLDPLTILTELPFLLGITHVKDEPPVKEKIIEALASYIFMQPLP